MAEKNKDQPKPSIKLQTKSLLTTITRSPMPQHKSISSKTSHTKQVKHSSHRTKAAFKAQPKKIFSSKESPRKKSPVHYHNLLDVISDESGDDDELFDSEPNSTNYQKRHNTQYPMKPPQLSVTMPSQLKSKISKNNRMQDLDYFERLDIADGKEVEFPKQAYTLSEMVSSNMVHKYIDVKTSRDEVESISFKKCDNDGVELEKSQGFTDMMVKHFPDNFAPVYRNIKSNQVVPKGDPVPRRKSRRNPAHELIAYYNGKCAGHIHG